MKSLDMKIRGIIDNNIRRLLYSKISSEICVDIIKGLDGHNHFDLSPNSIIIKKQLIFENEKP
jgi:hypothetical protein